MNPRVIRSGEHLLRLAATMGFSADDVWSHPANQDLAKRRASMHILKEGDIVYLPEPPPPRWHNVRVGEENVFVADVQTVDLAFTFKSGGKPLANAACRVEELPELTGLTTDDHGTLRFRAPVRLEAVTVTLTETGQVFRFGIGELDPPDTPSGLLQRLRNLGYVTELDERLAPEAIASVVAQRLAHFQALHGLDPTGVLDDATMSKLCEEHGC